jgi:hypothetical protein
MDTTSVFEKIVKEHQFSKEDSLPEVSSLSKEELNSFNVAQKYIKQDCENFKFFSNELRQNKEIIELTLQEDSELFQYIPKEIQKDEKLLLELHKEFAFSLKHLQDDLLKRKDFIKEILNHNCLYDSEDLKYLSEELLNDRELMKIALKIDSFSLAYFSEDLKNDKEMVLEGVTKNGLCIQYASEKLKSNKEIVKIAVENNGMSLIHLTDETILSDVEIAILGLSNFEDTLEYMNSDLQKHPKILQLLKK